MDGSKTLAVINGSVYYAGSEYFMLSGAVGSTTQASLTPVSGLASGGWLDACVGGAAYGDCYFAMRPEGIWAWGSQVQYSGTNHYWTGLGSTIGDLTPTQLSFPNWSGTLAAWDVKNLTKAASNGTKVWVWGIKLSSASFVDATPAELTTSGLPAGQTIVSLACCCRGIVAVMSGGGVYAIGANGSFTINFAPLVNQYTTSSLGLSGGSTTAWQLVTTGGAWVVGNNERQDLARFVLGKTDGTLWVWGREVNYLGVTGAGLETQLPTQVTLSPAPPAGALVVGASVSDKRFVYALNDGSVYLGYYTTQASQASLDGYALRLESLNGSGGGSATWTGTEAAGTGFEGMAYGRGGDGGQAGGAGRAWLSWSDPLDWDNQVRVYKGIDAPLATLSSPIENGRWGAVLALCGKDVLACGAPPAQAALARVYANVSNLASEVQRQLEATLLNTDLAVIDTLASQSSTLALSAHQGYLLDQARQALAVEVAGKSAAGHGHAIADVAGLQAALDTKQDVGGDLTGLTVNVGGGDPVFAASDTRVSAYRVVRLGVLGSATGTAIGWDNLTGLFRPAGGGVSVTAGGSPRLTVTADNVLVSGLRITSEPAGYLRLDAAGNAIAGQVDAAALVGTLPVSVIPGSGSLVMGETVVWNGGGFSSTPPVPPQSVGPAQMANSDNWVAGGLVQYDGAKLVTTDLTSQLGVIQADINAIETGTTTIAANLSKVYKSPDQMLTRACTVDVSQGGLVLDLYESLEPYGPGGGYHYIKDHQISFNADGDVSGVRNIEGLGARVEELRLMYDDLKTVVQANQQYCMEFGPQTDVEENLMGNDFGFNGNIFSDAFNVFSDLRLKDSVAELDPEECVACVLGVAPKSFVLKSDPTATLRYGFIAQEVRDYVPTVVSEKKGYLSLRKDDLVAVLWGAMRRVLTQFEQAPA